MARVPWAGQRDRQVRSATRPGRGVRTTTRSARKMASSTSWVTSSTEDRSSSHNPASHDCNSARVSASSAPNGSSRSNNVLAGQDRAQERRALPHAARELGRVDLAKPFQPEAPEFRPAPAVPPPRAASPRLRAQARRSRPWCAREAADRAAACRRLGRDVARRVVTSPSSRTAPRPGVISPATMSSNVLLPEPEGPTSATNSPAPTARLRPSRRDRDVAPRRFLSSVRDECHRVAGRGGIRADSACALKAAQEPRQRMLAARSSATSAAIWLPRRTL